MADVEARVGSQRTGGARWCEEFVGVGFRGGKSGGQGENVGEALGGVVGLRGGKALQVGEREGVVRGVEARDADDAGWRIRPVGE